MRFPGTARFLEGGGAVSIYVDLHWQIHQIG